MWWIPFAGLVVGLILAMALAPQGWRTVAVNWLMAIGCVVAPVALVLGDAVIGGQLTIGDVFPPWALPVFGAVWPLINHWLRSITTTPMGQKP